MLGYRFERFKLCNLGVKAVYGNHYFTTVCPAFSSLVISAKVTTQNLLSSPKTMALALSVLWLKLRALLSFENFPNIFVCPFFNLMNILYHKRNNNTVRLPYANVK